jgi:hypothetical protein
VEAHPKQEIPHSLAVTTQYLRQMCSIRVIGFQDCPGGPYHWPGEILKWTRADQRLDKAPCLPASASLRDLPRDLDVQTAIRQENARHL